MDRQHHANQLFLKKQYEAIYQHQYRPVIIADHLRNADNMGALIRLADNMGALSLWFLGDAATVNQNKLRRAAASSYKNMPWSFSHEPIISNLLPDDYTAVALETCAESSNLFKTELPQKCALVVGNERNGIRQEVLEQVSTTVYIPIPGPTKSLNVSHAAAIFLFEWLRRQMERISHFE